MICPTCGTESAPGKFCSNCGAELPAAEYEQQADGVNEYEQQGDYDEQAQGTEQYAQETFDVGDHEQAESYEQPPYDDSSFEQQPDAQSYQDQTEGPIDDLFTDSELETAVTDSTDDLFADDGGSGAAEAGADNELVDKTKEAATNFGNFFLSYLKEPMQGIKVFKDQLVSSVITLAIFALIISLNVYFMYRQVASMFNQGAFVDGFLMPFVGIIILFAVVIGITFAGISMTHKSGSFLDTTAKVGALAVPFTALYFLAFIVSLMGLTKVFITLAMTSILGTIIVIPSLIILEKPSKRFDQVFVLLGITLINLVAFSTILSSLLESIFMALLGGLMGGNMGGFPF